MNFAFLELPKRSLSCNQCTKSLEKEDFCYSGYEDSKRCDYCPLCWEGFAEKKEKNLYFWKTRIPKKNEKPTSMRKELRALAYLKEIIGVEGKEAEQFFLALYLMRKKLVYLKKEIEDSDQIYQIFEVIGTGEMLPIPKVPLAKLNSERAQKEIAAQLKD